MNVSTPSAPAPAKAAGRAKEYETIYVLRSDVDAEAAERIQARVADALDREQGKLVKVESWGRRKLAYPIGKQRKGVYVYLKYVGGGGLVAEVERNLKLQEAVVKFMTVQTGDAIDITALTIDPEEIKLGKIELMPEDEKEESREKQLGLVDFGTDMRAPHRGVEGGDVEDFVDEGAPPGDEAPASRADAGTGTGTGTGTGEEEK